jgi:hypothetical protein
MNISPIHTLPITTNPGIVPPWLQTKPGNGGIVPPWLERDLGHEATHPTTNPTWRADFTR